MAEASADCIIVGGGIGGAVLALILGRAKKHVVILERETEPRPAPRPEIHAQATLDTFRELGVAERILREAAIPLEGLRLHDREGKVLFEFTGEDFQRLAIQPHSVEPNKVRAILVEEAVATGSVEIHRGVEARDLTFHGMHVQGVRALEANDLVSWKCPLTVGDDGTASRVRRALAIGIHLKELPVEFVSRAGTDVAAAADPKRAQGWIHPEGINEGITGCLAMPQPGNRAVLLFLINSAVRERLMADGAGEQFREAALASSPACGKIDPKLLWPDDFAVFRRPFGHAKRYVTDGAALMGDAAHPVTPAGGQGANMSVADAVSLGRVALAAYENNNFMAPALAAYEAERRPANERSLRFSVWARRVFGTLRICPPAASLLRWFLGSVARDPAKKDQFMRSVSHAFESRRLV